MSHTTEASYRVEANQEGRWLFVSPEGEPFYSVGVNQIASDHDVDRTTNRCPYRDAVDCRYRDQDEWAAATTRRLESWGFNTVGAWSEYDRFADVLAYTPILDLNGAWTTGAVHDWFSPAFERRAAAIAHSVVAPRAQDPNLLGWFLDNEQRWDRDHRSDQPLLHDFLRLPEGAPGRAVAEEHRGDPRGFLRAAADQYFEVTTTAIREADPNHLILGIRANSILTPAEVVEAAGDWTDVFSVNNYPIPDDLVKVVADAWGPVVPREPDLRAFHELSGLPLLVTEFSFRASDAGLPNSVPTFYPVEPTQTERGERYAAYVASLFETPWIVGHHWFGWADQPPGGRTLDGEDNNFGLVSNDDGPWTALVEVMSRTNALAPHLGASVDERVGRND